MTEEGDVQTKLMGVPYLYPAQPWPWADSGALNKGLVTLHREISPPAPSNPFTGTIKRPDWPPNQVTRSLLGVGLCVGSLDRDARAEAGVVVPWPRRRIKPPIPLHPSSILLFPPSTSSHRAPTQIIMPQKPKSVRPRRVGPDSGELKTIAEAVDEAKRIVVIAGAGISTAAGIPVSKLRRLLGQES